MATKKSKAENANDRYTSWISEGISHRKQHSADWKRWLGYLDNETDLTSLGDSEYRLFINLAYMNWENMRPALFFQNPKFKAKARPGQDRPFGGNLAAKLVENVLDYYVHENDLKRESKLCITEAFALGVSVFKTGYHIPTKNITKKRVQLKKLSGLNDAMGLEDEDVSKAIKELEKADLEALSLHDIPDEEALWWKWTSIRNMGLPHGYGNWLGDCPWVWEKLQKRTKDALSEYPEIKKLGLEPTYFSGIGEDEEQADSYEVYEIWDWYNQEVVYTVPDKNRKQAVVKKNPWPKGLEKYPYDTLKFSEVPGQFYSKPDVKFYEDMQDVVSDTVSLAVTHLKRFKTMYQNDEPLSEEQKAIIESPVDGEVLDDPAFRSLKVVDRPPVPPESGPIVDRLLYFSDQLAGMTQTKRGSGRKLTATQVNEEAEGQDARMSEMQDILEDWLGAVGKSGVQLIQKNMSKKMMVDLAPQEAKVFGLKNPWMEASQETINAELDLWVVAGSTVSEDPAAIASRYEIWYNQSVNAPWVDQRLLWQKYSEKTLKMPIEEIESVMLPEQDPDAVGLASLENKLILRGETVDPPTPDQTHEVHVGIHQAGMQELQAFPQQFAQMQMQSQQYMQSGQQLPNDLNQAMQQMQFKLQNMEQAGQQLQAMIQMHEQMAAQAGMPLNRNLLNQKQEGGTTISGGSTEAETSGMGPV